MNNYEAHQQLVQQFKLRVQKDIPGIRVFDRIVGSFFTRNGARVRAGIPGQADLYFFYPGKNGMVYGEIEAKTGKAVQSKVQKQWESFIKSMNGQYFILRDINTTINSIKEFLK